MVKSVAIKDFHATIENNEKTKQGKSCHIYVTA